MERDSSEIYELKSLQLGIELRANESSIRVTEEEARSAQRDDLKRREQAQRFQSELNRLRNALEHPRARLLEAEFWRGKLCGIREELQTGQLRCRALQKRKVELLSMQTRVRERAVRVGERLELDQQLKLARLDALRTNQDCETLVPLVILRDSMDEPGQAKLSDEPGIDGRSTGKKHEGSAVKGAEADFSSMLGDLERAQACQENRTADLFSPDRGTGGSQSRHDQVTTEEQPNENERQAHISAEARRAFFEKQLKAWRSWECLDGSVVELTYLTQHGREVQVKLVCSADQYFQVSISPDDERSQKLLWRERSFIIATLKQAGIKVEKFVVGHQSFRPDYIDRGV